MKFYPNEKPENIPDNHKDKKRKELTWTEGRVRFFSVAIPRSAGFVIDERIWATLILTFNTCLWLTFWGRILIPVLAIFIYYRERGSPLVAYLALWSIFWSLLNGLFLFLTDLFIWFRWENISGKINWQNWQRLMLQAEAGRLQQLVTIFFLLGSIISLCSAIQRKTLIWPWADAHIVKLVLQNIKS